MKIHDVITRLSSIALIVLSGCGGGGGSSSDILGDVPALGQACNNNFHRELIGSYTGTVTFPSLNPDDITSIGSCKWDVDMTVSIRSSELGCFLDAKVTAPVTQDVVLAANDPLVYQCFADNSIRSVDDNISFTLSQEQLDAIPFPHTVELAPQSGVPGKGPYFGDVSISATHVHLIDAFRQPLKTLLFNGDGKVTVKSIETTTGMLTKENIQ